MWERTVDYALGVFDGAQGVEVLPHHDTYSFIFDGCVLARFKKASRNLLSSNYPTQMSLSFHNNESDLFGFEGIRRVEIVHVFNRFETELDWIGVVARKGDSVLWSYELPLLASGKVIPLMKGQLDSSAAAQNVLQLKPVKKNSNQNTKDNG